MKKLLTCFFVIACCIFLSAQHAQAQQRGNDRVRVSPNASVSQTIGTTVVTVHYGRPAIKSRGYFGEGSELAPAGAVWRTGANEATSITFSGNITFGGEEIDAGTYSLYSIPGGDEWTIILNNKQSWGTQYDESEDVLRVSANVSNGPEAEWFHIYFDSLTGDSANLVLHWGNTRVSIPLATAN